MSDLGALVALVAAFDTNRSPDAAQFPFNFLGSLQIELWDAGAERPAETAASFGEWIDGLRRRGVSSLRVAIPGINLEGELPDRLQFGITNSSESWLIAGGTREERWRTLWAVGDRDRPDRRIWRVLVQGVREPPGAPPI